MLIELLMESPLFLVAAVGLLGLLVGSFLNVLVYRLPIMMQREWQMQARELLSLPEEVPEKSFNLLLPASQCPHCGHAIRCWENIPLLSWLALRGRCSACQQAISPRYPLLELLCGLLSAGLAWHFGMGWALLLMLPLTWGLLAMSLIDMDHHLLPDSLVLPLLWLGLIANSFGLFTSLEAALWGAVWGYLSLWSLYWVFRLLTGKEGMGYGDFKLLAMLGAWGGWQILPLTLLLSSLLGALLGMLWLRLKGADRHSPIPFGPFLAVAGWIALLWGEAITSGYLGFAGIHSF
jgi:leader peptidase (prepilin peptidase) / N-methyltransferase